MARRILLSLLSLLVFGACTAMELPSAQAQVVISRNNPYRSFNLSGINYGSMQWERTHGNQGNYGYRSGYRPANRYYVANRHSGRSWRRR
jgi:hypothetical protein